MLCLEFVEFVSFHLWFHVNYVIQEIFCVRNFIRRPITLTRTSSIISIEICGKSFVRLEPKDKVFASSTGGGLVTSGSALPIVCERFIYANINTFLGCFFIFFKSDGHCCQLLYSVRHLMFS
jgi:hypothetical protein